MFRWSFGPLQAPHSGFLLLHLFSCPTPSARSNSGFAPQRQLAWRGKTPEQHLKNVRFALPFTAEDASVSPRNARSRRRALTLLGPTVRPLPQASKLPKQAYERFLDWESYLRFLVDTFHSPGAPNSQK